MSDADTAGKDEMKAETTVERREFLRRGAMTIGAGWLGLGDVRALLASAEAPSRAGGQPSVLARQAANEERLERAIRQMERHVRKNPDGTFELTARSPNEAGVDQEMYDQLRRSLEQGNEFVKASVKAGRLRADAVRATTGRPEDDAPGRPSGPGGR